MLEGLRAILEAAGSSLEIAVEVTAYQTNTDDKPGFERVCGEYLPEDAPGRITAEVDFFGLGILPGMDAIAFA